MGYVLAACQLLLVVVFAVSVVTKVHSRRAWSEFTAWVAGLAVVPSRLRAAAARTVTGLELGVLLLLLPPATRRLGLLVAAGLLAGFAVAVAVEVRRGVRAPCRCFGASAVRLGARHVVRNVLLVMVAATGVVAAGVAGPTHPAGLVVAATAGGVGAVVLILDPGGEVRVSGIAVDELSREGGVHDGQRVG